MPGWFARLASLTDKSYDLSFTLLLTIPSVAYLRMYQWLAVCVRAYVYKCERLLYVCICLQLSCNIKKRTMFSMFYGLGLSCIAFIYTFVL